MKAIRSKAAATYATLLERYWGMPRLRKFYLGFVVCLAVACIWHGYLVLDAYSGIAGGNNWVWAKHELTFLIAHPFLFAPAVGIVLSVLNRDFLRGLRRGELIALVLLILGSLVLTYIDHIQPPPNRLSEWLGLLETGFFMTTVFLFLWYVVIALSRRAYEDPPVLNCLVAALILYALWIPLRIYADGAVPFAGNPAGLDAHFEVPRNNIAMAGQTSLALIVLLLTAFVFFVLAWRYLVSPHPAIVIAVISGVAALITAMFFKQALWIPPCFHLIESLRLVHFVAIFFVTMFVIYILALLYLR
jgi:hypothetical protein